MKIAMTVEEKSLQASVSETFGCAQYLLIYDTVSKAETFLENVDAMSHGCLGILPANKIVDNKADCLITSRCDSSSAEIFKTANIKIYKAVEGSVKQNIDALAEGKLSLLKSFYSYGGE